MIRLLFILLLLFSCDTNNPVVTENNVLTAMSTEISELPESFPSILSYGVGQQISISDQQQNFDVCNGIEPNGETEGDMSLYDYNGDVNGGAYYVFHIDMAASW